MTDRRVTNVAASVRERLLNHARAQGQDFQLVLTHYAIERLLYRLGHSRYAGRFILKGAMLFRVWEGPSARQTRDLDLLGFGDPDDMAMVFREVTATPTAPDDGLVFDPASMSAEPIRDQAEYRGQRVRLLATLGVARIPLQVDIGFGDDVTPSPIETAYPTLLDLPAPTIRTYPRETVVAEKFQAMVSLSTANTRVKDYFDVCHLAQRYEFDGKTLASAVQRTFARRRTEMPNVVPLGLSDVYLTDPVRISQWTGFSGRTGEASTISLADAGAAIRELVLPVTRSGFSGVWRPGGPWTGPSSA